MRACGWIAVLGALALLVSCSEDGGGDIPADDDTAPPPPFAATPPTNEVLGWDGCIELIFDYEVQDVRVRASDGDGNDVLAFVGFMPTEAMVRPMEPWPVGDELTLVLIVDDVPHELVYDVEIPEPIQWSPKGRGGAFTTSHALQCPDLLEVIDCAIGMMDYTLVEVTDFDGHDQVTVMLAQALGSGYEYPQTNVRQYTCKETLEIEAQYDDPILHVASDAWQDWSLDGTSARHTWGAVQLTDEPSDGGYTSAKAVWGHVWEATEGVYATFCDDPIYQSVHTGCGPCPDEPETRCFYFTHHSWIFEPMTWPIEPATADDIASDPDC